MGETVGGRAEDDPLSQTGATPADHQQIGPTDLDHGEKPVHRVAQLLDHLVVDTGQVEVLLYLVEDLLLALHEGCGQGLRGGRSPAQTPPAFRGAHHRHQLDLCVPVPCDGHTVFGEATTSWSYVGPGLRLSAELLGPEYSMSVSTLESGTKVFFSRRLQGAAGEDLLEKQNAEQGLMPIVGNESAEYGYEGENRAFVQAFVDGVQPDLGWYAGRDVTELLMTCYMSAEQERVLPWKPAGLEQYQPPVARRAERSAI